jgi:hypothetical protein
MNQRRSAVSARIAVNDRQLRRARRCVFCVVSRIELNGIHCVTLRRCRHLEFVKLFDMDLIRRHASSGK